MICFLQKSGDFHGYNTLHQQSTESSLMSESNVMICVENLKLECDPIQNPPWETQKPISMKEISHCIENSVFETVPFGAAKDKDEYNHSARIAYLVVFPDSTPILIDVGIPEILSIEWMVEDGNHRLAAAIYRNDKYISAEICGCVDFAKELFDCEFFKEAPLNKPVTATLVKDFESTFNVAYKTPDGIVTFKRLNSIVYPEIAVLYKQKEK